MITLRVKTDRRAQLVHITAGVQKAVQESGVAGGRLLLGRWQGIFFCEFDGPRNRSLYLRVVAEPHLRIPRWSAKPAELSRFVLQFFTHHAPRHLYSGSVLPDEMYLL